MNDEVVLGLVLLALPITCMVFAAVCSTRGAR